MAGDVANVLSIRADRDPDFLGDLTPHGLLRGFPRFDESREGGEPSGLPPALAPEQCSILTVDDEHDDRWVGSREMLRVISGAAPCPASHDGLGTHTTSRTVGMTAEPVIECDRGDCEFSVIAQWAELAQAMPEPLLIRVVDMRGEEHGAIDLPEQGQLRIAWNLGDGIQLQMLRVAHGTAPPVNPQRAVRRIGSSGIEPGGIGAQLCAAIEHGPTVGGAAVCRLVGPHRPCNDAEVNIFIRQLTGIRFIAAAWVLLYHLQGPLNVIGLGDVPVFSDVLRIGRLGVDLFFALSGFILTHTYLTRMGPRFQVRQTGRFLWLRLARIYPVHLVMLVVAGVAVIAQARVTGTELNRTWFTATDFIKQLFLVQEWGPDPQRGWNFVAWSLSMEWLAYLFFPFLVLVFFLLFRRGSTLLLVAAWIAVLTPLVWYGLGTQDPYYTGGWGSTIRVMTEFTAGAITYLIVRRLIPDGALDPSVRVERVATMLSFVLPLLVVLAAVFLANWDAAQPPMRELGEDAEPLPPYFHLVLVPLLIAWIGSLALARRGMARWLATSTLVLGGFISYSLYMTHLVWFGLWRAGMSALGIDGGWTYAVATIVLIVGALAIAYGMWRWVEEPAREWMRARIGVRPQPTEEAGEAIARSEPSALDAEPITVPQEDPPAAGGSHPAR